MIDKEKDLRDWRLERCDEMPIVTGIGTGLCCDVLGEKFCEECKNDNGERCRYSNGSGIT